MNLPAHKEEKLRKNMLKGTHLMQPFQHKQSLSLFCAFTVRSLREMKTITLVEHITHLINLK